MPIPESVQPTVPTIVTEEFTTGAGFHTPATTTLASQPGRSTQNDPLSGPTFVGYLRGVSSSIIVNPGAHVTTVVTLPMNGVSVPFVSTQSTSYTAYFTSILPKDGFSVEGFSIALGVQQVNATSGLLDPIPARTQVSGFYAQVTLVTSSTGTAKSSVMVDASVLLYQ